MIQSPPLKAYEWVVVFPSQGEKRIYQMKGLHLGKCFYHLYANFYKDEEDKDPHEVIGEKLRRIWVTTTGRDLCHTRINPEDTFNGPI